MKGYQPTRGYYALRWEILERDNFTCQYCGQQAPNVKLEVDHKITVEDGGATDQENLVTSCYACNRGKSGLTIIRRRKTNNTALPYSPRISIGSNSWRQDSVFEYIKLHPNSRPKEIAQELNIAESNVRILTSRLLKRHRIRKEGKGWYVAV